MEIERLKKRYENDPTFFRTVNAFYQLIGNDKMTQFDLTEACFLAKLKIEAHELEREMQK